MAVLADLGALGVPRDLPLMVHASMRALSPLDAEDVLDDLLEHLAPGGTLVFPLGSPEGVAFDAATSPCDPEMGVLAEVFRRRGARVNDHPAARFGAIGPDAEAILEPIALHDYYAPPSPLSRFVERGWVLRIAADEDTVTVTHHAEYVARLAVEKRRVTRRYVRADTGPVDVESLDDCDGIVEEEYFADIWLDYLAAGHPRVGAVSGARAELFEAAPFVAHAVAWLEARYG